MEAEIDVDSPRYYDDIYVESLTRGTEIVSSNFQKRNSVAHFSGEARNGYNWEISVSRFLSEHVLHPIYCTKKLIELIENFQQDINEELDMEIKVTIWN